MNDTEDIMTTSRTSHSFQALDVALQAAGTAIDLVKDVSGQYRSLQDQVIRSAASVPSNIAEGNGRSGKDRKHFFRIAMGSAREVDVQLRILANAEVVEAEKTAEALVLFDRVRAMLCKLGQR